uniref:non-specific serine/threonine protein kinase n=1 Tax=Ascaris lumbricoides TaxID=6252 RepID=A0A0M3I7G9_ASCLU
MGFGKWRIRDKLDEGGFGHVYLVEDVEKHEFAALKAEPNDTLIVSVLNRNGDMPHVVQIYHSAKHRKFCYMIVTLLGDNLRTLKECLPGRMMSPSTWSRIGIQCLYAIKMLHDSGFVHRDIKPANFVMGNERDPDRSRCVHILDFGLARIYAYERNGVWIARRARASARFRGTIRYCSPSVHERKEQGRKDDIWSLIYVLIEFHCGLPWQKERNKHKLEEIKLKISDDELLKNFPAEMHDVLPHLRTLNCYNRPDYSMIYTCFLRLIERIKVQYDDRYDWETSVKIQPLLKMRTKRPAYENADEFFRCDPIKIDAPPPIGSDITSRMLFQIYLNTFQKISIF